MAALTTARASQYASLEDMQAWAAQVMERMPDFVIGGNYLRRWWIVPRNEGSNTYLHETLRSDDDRAMHDHPWDNRSYIIVGSYIEHTPEGSFLRKAGDVVSRKAADRHRLELPEGGRCVSLFTTGPKIREWGFWCPQGFVPWQEFVSVSDAGAVGKGCA